MGSSRSRVAVGAAIGTVLLLVTALGVAGAGTRIHNKVDIKTIDPDGVAGVVKSAEEACEKGRKVKLFYTAQARGPATEVPVGSDKTNKKGKWAIEGSFFVGHYHAVVKSKHVSTKLERGKLEDAPEEVEEEEDEDSMKDPDTCSTTDTTKDE